MKKTFLFLAALAMSAMTWAETATYTKVTSNPTDWSGDYILVYETDGAARVFTGVDAANDFVEATISDNTITGEFVTLTLETTDGGYLVKINGGDNDGKYISSSGNSNGLTFGTSGAVMTISYDESVLMTNAGGAVMRYNKTSGQDRFRFYKASSYTQQQPVQLYKAGSTPTPVTLEGIVIKGTASKLEYFVGEAFDPAGLEVWGIYTKTVKGDSTSQIKSGITWTTDPEVLAKEDISVDVTAQYKDFTSEVFTVNNIVVKEKPAAKYVPVAWNEIEDGGKYFITANNDGEYYFAAKAFAAKGALAIAFDATLAPEADMWTFTKGDGVWKISAADGAGLYMNNDNNGLVCAANKGADFTVAQGSSAEFTDLTASDGSNTRYVALYNQQDFRCYKTSSTSGIRDLKLYGLKKEGVVTKPSFTPAESEFDGSVEVTLTADEGAEIYYTLDATTPTNASTKYESAFTLTATTTVKAIAIKDGKSSEVAEKTYTLIPVFESLEALVTELPATETNVTVIVTITNAAIDSFYVTSKGQTNGIYTHAGKTVVELYEYNVPETWVVGGKVSGKIQAQWGLYKGTAELQKWENGWNAFTYTAPSDPTSINNVKANAKATKAIVNGQIVIVRDNKTYNVLGF